MIEKIDFKIVQSQHYDIENEIPFKVQVKNTLDGDYRYEYYVFNEDRICLKCDIISDKELIYLPKEIGRYKVKVKIYHHDEYITSLMVPVLEKEIGVSIAYLDYSYDKDAHQLCVETVLDDKHYVLYSYYIFGDEKLVKKSVRQISPKKIFTIALDDYQTVKIVSTVELNVSSDISYHNSMVEIIK